METKRVSKVQPGATLYEVAAGTTVGQARKVTRPVKIIRIVDGGAIVSWNGNAPAFWPDRSLKRLRKNP